MAMIISSVAYKQGARLSDITVDDFSEMIKQPDTFVWLGLYEPDGAMLLKTQEEFHLHELSIEDARNAHQRPKIETYGDSMFFVLKAAQFEEGKSSTGRRICSSARTSLRLSDMGRRPATRRSMSDAKGRQGCSPRGARLRPVCVDGLRRRQLSARRRPI